MKKTKCNTQQGFTLIELVVVVAIIGLLASLLAPSVIGSKDGARSELLLKTSRDFAQNWMLISQQCGTTTAVASSPIPASGKTAADVIFGGVSNVAAAYQSCYAQAKVIPMSEVAQLNGSGWTVQGYAVSIVGGGTQPLQTVYTGVPEELALLMAQTYNPTLSGLLASDGSSNVVRYGTSSAGTRTVTVLRQIS